MRIRNMWILVLMFINGSGSGITSISDFPTEKACIESGEQWKKNDTSSFGPHYKYKCIYAEK